MENILAMFKDIKHFVLDIDGVLTDGSLILDPYGNLLRTMNIKDGYAMQLAIKKGYSIFIISGANNEIAKMRLNKLGISEIYFSVPNKLSKLTDIIETHVLERNSILYMGDDMPDLEVMQHVGLPVCPSDACVEVKQIAKYISPIAGGKGCVRDVMEKVMKLNGDWE